MFKKKSKDAPAGEAAPEGEAAPTEGGGKKKPPMMLIIGAAAGLLVVLGGGGAAAFFLMKPAPAADQHAKKDHAKDKKKDKDKDTTKSGKPGAEADVGEVRDGPNGSSYYTLPDLVVNMDTADGRPTFLKLKVTFEISDPDTVDLVQEDAPRMQDMFTAFLRELRPEDLAGSQGTYQLKAEILRRANLVLSPHKIDAVLIEEMLVQ
jgi:flagellar FliL protein